MRRGSRTIRDRGHRGMAILFVALGLAGHAVSADEEDHWTIRTLPEPEGVVLEVGGLLPLGGGEVMACTRRGEVWVIENAFDPAATTAVIAGSPEDEATVDDPHRVRYVRFADGLQEPLGLATTPEEDRRRRAAIAEGRRWFGPVYVAQRGEISRMTDVDRDRRLDRIETICDDWSISGNYHEYTFGPVFQSDGDLWFTLNRPFGSEPFGKKDWRGWAMRIGEDGAMRPEAAGLRSPCGVAVGPDDRVYYTDNQGEWCGASKLSIIEPGDFHGHPWGVESTKRPESNVEFPGEIPDGIPMPEAARTIPNFKMPVVWFPYDKCGKSPGEVVWDVDGVMGPFAGQAFMGDQHHAAIYRICTEEVDGHVQGAVFPFREGFQCGIIRMAIGEDGSLLVGQTNRGWGGRGNARWGVQALSWNGETPFEVRTMEATPDGFRLTFTRPVDPATAVEPTNYDMSSYTYLLHSPYGSPETDTEPVVVKLAAVSGDRMTVELTCEPLRAGYVHELRMDRLRDEEGEPLVHPDAYYTLVRIPKVD
ncbi:MAG: hypothetical protein VX012_05695 [Planctomycetota bacterium]|nr:hypothetical protein [Planctomycetota bacterium]